MNAIVVDPRKYEKTAFPERLATLALEGCLITIDAMGTQPNTAQAIRHRGADYLLAVKDNQPTLAESIGDFINAFAAVLGKTPHRVHEVVEKDPAGWKSGAATSSTSSTACTHPTRSA